MRSNLGPHLQIGRPRVKGARSGGTARREQGPRGGGVAGEGEPGAAGLVLRRGLARDGVRRVRNAPGLTAGLGEVLLGLAAAWGGAAAKTLAGASALGDAKAYGLR